MTEPAEAATLELLHRISDEAAEYHKQTEARFAAIDARFNKVDKNIGLLDDGLLSLRLDVKNLTATVETIAISTASHGVQLAELDERVGRIEKHLNITE